MLSFSRKPPNPILLVLIISITNAKKPNFAGDLIEQFIDHPLLGHMPFVREQSYVCPASRCNRGIDLENLQLIVERHDITLVTSDP